MKQDLNDLYYFVKSIEYGGFSQAERALGIPKSRLSRRLQALEESLGVRLVYRSTRHFSLTDVGETYYHYCVEMLEKAKEAQEAIEMVQTEPRGVIRLTCPITLLDFHVNEMLAQFMIKYPDVTLHLQATNRAIDLVGEGVDVAIRVRPEPLDDSELIIRHLGHEQMALVASPQLIAQQGGIPNTPQLLKEWPTLALGRPQQNHHWLIYDRADIPLEIEHKPRMITTDMLALRRAALAGVGVVQLPFLVMKDAIESGDLVNLFPHYRSSREIVHVVYPSRKGVLPAIRALIDHLVESFRAIEGELSNDFPL